jgi:hypothetical protein
MGVGVEQLHPLMVVKEGRRLLRSGRRSKRQHPPVSAHAVAPERRQSLESCATQGNKGKCGLERVKAGRRHPRGMVLERKHYTSFNVRVRQASIIQASSHASKHVTEITS